MNGIFNIRRIDPYSLVMDLLRNLWVAILGASAVVMLLVGYTQYNHHDTYTCTTTFVVMSKSTSNNVYYNLSAANSMATTFASILDSDALKQMVMTDLELDSYDATTYSSIMGDTNILQLSVTAESPQLSYNIMRSIIRNYSSLTQYASSSMVMSVLKQPDVPTYSNNSLNIRGSLKKWFLYAMVLFLLIIAYLSIQQDTIKSNDDLTEKLDAKSLGVIYYERKKIRLKKLKTSKLLVTDLSASFSFVEEYRKIATRITHAMSEEQKVIIVTSVRENEGKSTTAANIALTLAKEGKNVIVIDGDLRNPSMHKIFNKKVEKGHSLPDLLNGTVKMSQYMITHEDMSLALLLTGSGYNNSTEIISNRKMKQFVDKLRTIADYIIIDSPPMSAIADAQVLANYADVSVMVVQYNRSKADEINDDIDILKDYHAPVCGAVLNGVRTLSVPAVGYGYGRYGRYGYGKYGAYGKYGKYGKYGRYGHYAKNTEESEEEEAS